MQGDKTQKVAEARDGDIVAVAKVDTVKAGEWLGAGKLPPPIESEFPSRNFALAIEPADRKDDVRLSGALQRLLEEDCALILEHDEASHEMRLKGVNDEHLNTVLARLKRRYGVEVKSHAPTIGYRESIRRSVTQKGRHKKQSGGHGQFGDVGHRDQAAAARRGLPASTTRSPAAPCRGSGSRRSSTGSRTRCSKGPLGFPVVDVAVTLIDGSYHSVDSSELAFRMAGRIAMQEALAAASPHLLEPVQRLTVVCPSSATSRITSAIASRRGQMLGMAPRDGWTGWDRVDALIPEAELGGLEAELQVAEPRPRHL